MRFESLKSVCEIDEELAKHTFDDGEFEKESEEEDGGQDENEGHFRVLYKFLCCDCMKF
jgi:hypothetical protein